jgi:hypothetical protein
MAETYFERFCKILDDNTILKKSTAIGVMVDLKYCIKEIKSEVLLELQNKGESKNDYLDYLINEIEKQDYIKEADISYIQKYLEQYNITISEIFDMNFMKNLIVSKIDRHYDDMIPFSPEKDEAFIIQSNFLNYFCKYYADELITFLKLKKTNQTLYLENQIKLINKPFKDEILETFLEEINNINDLYKYTFIQCYDFGIKKFTDSLILEIKENILLLPQEKIKIYLEYVIDKIKSSNNYSNEDIYLEKWINKYNVLQQDFPYLENSEINNLITKSITYHLWDEEDKLLMESIQLDFFYYAIKTESDKVINYINSFSNPVIENKISSKKTVSFDPIFISFEVFEQFNELVEYLKIDTSNIKKRGNQAKFNAIWSCPSSFKYFFKDLTELNEYITFINKAYLTNYNSRTLSDGSKYYITIKNWISE